MRIQLEVDSDASWFVGGPPKSVSIVPAIDLIFPIVHLFRDDRL